MAYQELHIPVQFAGGLESKMDEKLVPLARLTGLENGVFTKATTIAKRNGYDALGNNVDGESLPVSSTDGLAARDNELLRFADGALFSYRATSNTWSRVGDCLSLKERSAPIARTASMQSMPDHATLDGVTLAAWEDSNGGVWWSLVDISGRVLRPPVQVAADGSRPRCVAVGDRLHLYYVDASASRLYVLVVTPANHLESVTPQVLADTLRAGNPVFDACTTTRTETPALLCWATNAGSAVAYVDKSGAIGSAITGHPGSSFTTQACQGPIACAYVQDEAIVVTTVASEYTATRYDGNDLAALVCSTDYDTGASIVRVALAGLDSLDGGAGVPVVVAWEHAGATARDNLTQLHWVDLGAVSVTSGPVDTQRSVGLVTRGFAQGGAAYFVVGHDVDYFPFLATLRAAVPTREQDAAQALRVAVVARTLAGSADGLPARSHLAGVSWDASGASASYCALYREQVAAAEGDEFSETSIKLVTLAFASQDRNQWVQYGRDTIIAGACPLRYDGDRVAELGFHTAPDGAFGAVASAGGSISASAGYLYVAAYEEYDAAGERHLGATSIPVAVTTGAGQGTVTLSIPTYRLTSKRSVRICVYRSGPDDTTGDPILYKVTDENPAQITGANRFLHNDPTVDTLTFVDTLADGDLVTRERCYTTGGVLSNDPAPVGEIIAQGRGRLFFNDPSDPNLVRYSQEKRDGIGAEIASDLALRVDDAGGPITALGVLDDAVVVFKQSAIYFFAGPGPLANPDAAPQVGFSNPVQIASDVGCTSPRSIGVTPVGLMFQSDKGLYLLRRDRQVQYIGAPVERYNAQRVVSSLLMPGRTQILCLCAEGNALLFDYFHQQWSTFTNHAGPDAAVVNGAYYYARNDGRIFRENLTSFRDDTSDIRLKFTTAWIKLAQYLQGMQKIWWITFIGTYKSPHLLRVRLQLDYERGFGAPQDLDMVSNYISADYGEGAYGDDVYGGSPDTVYQQRVHVGAKCQSFRVQIEDVANGTDALANSFDLAEMLVVGGIMRGSNKLGPGRSDASAATVGGGGGIG